MNNTHADFSHSLRQREEGAWSGEVMAESPLGLSGFPASKAVVTRAPLAGASKEFRESLSSDASSPRRFRSNSARDSRRRKDGRA
jgi:hypothetical protein